MFKNYLVTAWRHILKNRLFSAINVFGLAVGMMSCILILLYVKAETSYDKWIPESEKIVRLHSAFHAPERPPFITVRSAGRLMEALRDFASAEVEAGVRLLNDDDMVVIQGDSAFPENGFYADASFFDVFDLPFAHGSAATAFANPLDLVISEEIAMKYFGRTDVVGETITICCVPRERTDLKISGVLKDMPQASHFDVDFLILMDPKMFDFAPNLLNTWGSVNVFTYFKMRDGIAIDAFRERLHYWLNNESPFVQMLAENGMGDVAVTDVNRADIMALEDLHLHARKAAGNFPDLSAMGDINMIYTFTAVAGLVLLIASINFMNLSTARAVKRAREVAVRKVMGASRKQVALQFLGEAVAVSGLGFLFAMVGVELVLPIYSEAIGIQLELNLFEDLPLLLSLMGVAFAVGMLSGTYPAAFISRFLPAKVLQGGKTAETEGASTFRSALVVFQFAISIGLTVCTVVVYGQTLYAQNMDVGYKYDGKLVLGNLYATPDGAEGDAFRNQLASIPGVSSVVYSSDVPSQDFENNTGFTRLNRDSQGSDNSAVVLNIYSVDYGYMETYEIAPIAGRTFDPAYGTDTIVPIEEGEDRVGVAGLMMNESAVRSLGFKSPEEAIGKVLSADMFRAGQQNLTIIGVIPDIYFRSIKHGVRSSVYFVQPNRYRSATISFDSTNVPALVEAVEKVWRENVPLTPISRQFLSDMMNAQYDAEARQAKLFASFAILAIVVACLGLYGLASFTAEQRTKEIGIRKILGATVTDIIRLLVWQFSRPVLIANIIAWPVAWYLMSGWLEGFEYRLESSFLLTAGLVASVVALIIAWLTIASRACKVAQANPINALRYE